MKLFQLLTKQLGRRYINFYIKFKNLNIINFNLQITGSKAPPLKNLNEWLDKNPKFEVDPKWGPLLKEKVGTFKTPVCY